MNISALQDLERKLSFLGSDGVPTKTVNASQVRCYAAGFQGRIDFCTLFLHEYTEHDILVLDIDYDFGDSGGRHRYRYVRRPSKFKAILQNPDVVEHLKKTGKLADDSLLVYYISEAVKKLTVSQTITVNPDQDIIGEVEFYHGSYRRGGCWTRVVHNIVLPNTAPTMGNRKLDDYADIVHIHVDYGLKWMLLNAGILEVPEKPPMMTTLDWIIDNLPEKITKKER